MPDAADRDVKAEPGPPACAIDPDTECPVCAGRGLRVRMLPVKAHYQCPECRYFDSCCMWGEKTSVARVDLTPRRFVVWLRAGSKALLKQGE